MEFPSTGKTRSFMIIVKQSQRVPFRPSLLFTLKVTLQNQTRYA